MLTLSISCLWNTYQFLLQIHYSNSAKGNEKLWSFKQLNQLRDQRIVSLVEEGREFQWRIDSRRKKDLENVLWVKGLLLLSRVHGTIMYSCYYENIWLGIESKGKDSRQEMKKKKELYYSSNYWYCSNFTYIISCVILWNIWRITWVHKELFKALGL